MIRFKSQMPIAMETVWVCYIRVNCQVSEFLKLLSNVSVFKIYQEEIPNNESIQENFLKFWEIENF